MSTATAAKNEKETANPVVLPMPEANGVSAPVTLDDPSLYINRELSWLEFNRRVLEEAQDPKVPLLERVKFLSIFSSNLDEFFMVRVAELKRRIHAGDQTPGPDGLTPAETTEAVAARVRELVDAQHHCFLGEIEPLLTAAGIRLLRPKE